MALPIVGGDHDTWGDKLNSHLTQMQGDIDVTAEEAAAAKTDATNAASTANTAISTANNASARADQAVATAGEAKLAADEAVQAASDDSIAALMDDPTSEVGKRTAGRMVLPTGDPTGAGDVAEINAALVEGDVRLRGDFWLNAPIRIPSNRTLVLAGAHVRLVDGADCSIIENANQDAVGNNNIQVIGAGLAHLDGNATGQTTGIGISFVNVTGAAVANVTIGPCNDYAALMQGVVDATWKNIHLAQDGATANQDGIDIGPGCHNIKIGGVTGRTGDDGFSIFAQTTAAATHNLFKTGGWDASISDVSISDVQLDVGMNAVRLQAGDGFTLHGVNVNDFINTNPNASNYAVLMFGESGYVTTLPATEDLAGIYLSGYRGPGNVIIGASTHFSDVHVSDVVLTKPWKSFIGVAQVSPSFGAQMADISIENVTTLDGSTGATGTISNLAAGARCEGLAIRNVYVRRCQNILNNSGEVVGLAMSDITVRYMPGQVIRSAINESGDIDGVLVQSPRSGPRYSVLETRLRLGPNMPAFGDGDLFPNPITAGAMIHTDGTVDPTGAGYALPARYVSDGTRWARIATADEGAYGFPYTMDPSGVRSSDSATLTANTSQYYRVVEGGTVSAIALRVATSSGNIDVGVYRNAGSGRASRPGARVASSGSVACPAAGDATISLGSEVAVFPGDWLAIAADNNTAAFRSGLLSPQSTILAEGRAATEATFPLPSTATPTSAEAGRLILLVGA